MPKVNVPGVGAINFPDSMSQDDIVKAIQTNILPKYAAQEKVAPTEPTEKSSLLRRAGDLGISAAQGVVGLGEAAVGLADIPTFGLTGKAAEAGEKALFGGTTKDLQAYLEKQKTPETQLAQKKVAEAKGFFPTAGALLENPSALLGSVAESVPSMIGGAGIGRMAMKAVPKLAGKPLAAAAIGEGAISAGSTAESIRQQQEDGMLSPMQAGIAGVSGVLTGTLGIFGGKLAKELKITDIDELMVGGVKTLGTDPVKKNILLSAAKGALAESVFEELPQSMQEQIANNLATGKPWDENVAEAGASGAMAALIMGGGGAGAAQAITNANAKAAENKKNLARDVEQVKPGNSMFDDLDAEEAIPSDADILAMNEEKKAKGKKKAKQTVADTSFNFGANQTPAELTQEEKQEKQDKADADFEKYLFPLRAGSNRNEDGVRTRESVQQEYDNANAQLDEAMKSGVEGDYEAALERVKRAREDATDFSQVQAPLFTGRKQEDEAEQLRIAESHNQADIAIVEGKIVRNQNIVDTYTADAKTALAKGKQHVHDELLNTYVARSQKIIDDLQPELDALKQKKEAIQQQRQALQPPMQAGQEGFDFGAPTDERAQKIEPNKTDKKQSLLDFLQDASTGQVATTTTKSEAPKFGFTTETSVTPLMQFMAQVKPRSSSPVEQNKQQQAITGLNDEIAGLFDGIDEKDIPYFKGVVDSFFDKYASGTNLPSKQSDFENLNNLSSEDQKSVLNKHTHLPDLTTYEGAKKLADAFQDHVAEAQLAGLGITKSSSAYQQAVPFVRQLRKKPKSEYDDAEQAAYNYFSMFDFDTALRAAAFDSATNTPRNQLFRGQGKESADKFHEWITLNTPVGTSVLFTRYLRAYEKQNQGFKDFETLEQNKQNEAEYVQSVTSPKKLGPGNELGRSAKYPLHPAIVANIRNNNLQGALEILAKTGKTPWERTLAAKLAELELSASIGVNTVEQLAEDYTATTKDLLDKFADGIKIYFPDIPNLDASIKAVWDNAPNNFNRFTHMQDLLLRIKEKLAADNIEVGGAVLDIMKDLKEKVTDIVDSFNADGVYFPISNAISMNSTMHNQASAMTPYVLLHETTHAATARIVANPLLYSSKQQAAVVELKRLYEFAKTKAKGRYFYGLENVDEFIAEAFTSKSFQEFLKGIPYKYANTSLFDKFVEFCLKIIGYNNVLSSTIANVNVLFNAPTENTFKNAPPAFAKRNIGMFEGNSAERSKPFDVLNDLVKNNKNWPEVKDKFSRMLSTMNTQYRKHWLGAFTLRQMEEMIGYVYGKDPETGKMGRTHKLPEIHKFIGLVEDMAAERGDIIKEATAISKRLMAMQSENQPTVEKLTQIIQTATSNEVDPTGAPPMAIDPTQPTAEEQKKAAVYRLLKSEWDALGKMPQGAEAHKLYNEIKQFYIDQLTEFKAMAYQREYERLLAIARKNDKDSGANIFGDPNSAEAQAEIQNIKDKAQAAIDKKYSDRIQPYFPLKRFGEFWVRVGKGDSRKYFQFEDASAMEKFLAQETKKYEKQLRSQGMRDEAEIAKLVNSPDYINAGNSLPELSGDLFSDKKVFDTVKEIVESAGGTTITDPEQLRQLINDEIGELYITTLPLQSIQRMFMHRQNIAGASTDLVRSFQHSAFHMAYQHARFKYAPMMDNQLAAAKDTIRIWEDRDEKRVLQDYYNEIENKYKNNILKPPPSNFWVNIASNANFLMYLTAPASAIVNMLAVPSIALPVLGGKFGAVKTWKAMSKYMTMLSGSGWKDFSQKEYDRIKEEDGDEAAEKYKKDAPFDAPSIGRSPKLTDLQKRAFAAASDSLLEQSLANDAAALSENPSLDYTGTWGKIMEIASFPFHKAERFNREITYMAAFELAYEKNGGDFDAAVAEAKNLTWKTMFDYATYNKPKYFQGNTAKILLAFKQYAQHMTYLLFRTAFEATQGIDKAEYDAIAAQYGERDEAEGKRVADKYAADTLKLRTEARKQFMLLMGMSFMFAGAAGLPIWWMYAGMAKAFNAVFGNPEEPYDVENEFKNSMNTVFGGFAGDVVSRGLIPQLTGVSLSDRMSTNLPDMWFRDTKKNVDEVEWVNQTLINLMGPTVGMAINVAEGLKRFNNGQTERAFEAFTPAAVKNLLAGSRIATEGALTMKGDTLLENVSGIEAFEQMLGFTPERLAQKQSANIEAKASEQAVVIRRQNLLNFLSMAIEREDEAAEAKVLAKIEEYNEANDWLPIKASTIRSSLKKRAKERAMANELGGIRVNKKFADLAEEKTAYANEDDDE